MKKIIIVILLFIGLGIGERLSSVTREEAVSAFHSCFGQYILLTNLKNLFNLKNLSS